MEIQLSECVVVSFYNPGVIHNKGSQYYPGDKVK